MLSRQPSLRSYKLLWWQHLANRKQREVALEPALPRWQVPSSTAGLARMPTNEQWSRSLPLCYQSQVDSVSLLRSPRGSSMKNFSGKQDSVASSQIPHEATGSPVPTRQFQLGAALRGVLWPAFSALWLPCGDDPICTRSGQESQSSRVLTHQLEP